jgi:hypothetical protein
MFGHGFDALEGLLALIAAIDVGWHSRGPPFTSRLGIREYVAPDPAGERTVPPPRPPCLARSRSGDSQLGCSWRQCAPASGWSNDSTSCAAGTIRRRPAASSIRHAGHGPGAAWRCWTLHGDRNLRTEDKNKSDVSRSLPLALPPPDMRRGDPRRASRSDTDAGAAAADDWRAVPGLRPASCPSILTLRGKHLNSLAALRFSPVDAPPRSSREPAPPRRGCAPLSRSVNAFGSALARSLNLAIPSARSFS